MPLAAAAPIYDAISYHLSSAPLFCHATLLDAEAAVFVTAARVVQCKRHDKSYKFIRHRTGTILHFASPLPLAK